LTKTYKSDINFQSLISENITKKEGHLQVKIFVPKGSRLEEGGFLGSYLFKRAIRRLPFLIKEDPAGSSEMVKVLAVEGRGDNGAEVLKSYFTPAVSQSLADRFDVVVKVGRLGYLPLPA
jgi:hypothetical protein